MKQCKKCLKTYPVNEFQWRSAEHRIRRKECRTCGNAYRLVWSHKNKELSRNYVVPSPKLRINLFKTYKYCYPCNQIKPKDMFGKHAGNTDGLQALCRECSAAYLDANREHINSLKRNQRRAERELTNFRNRSYYQENRDKLRMRNLTRPHNISPERYEELRASQDSKCAICRKDGRLCIDHDHSCCAKQKSSCGTCIRGLLCSTCNSALGFLKDSPQLLRTAADYLEFHAGTRVPITNGFGEDRIVKL